MNVLDYNPEYNISQQSLYRFTSICQFKNILGLTSSLARHHLILFLKFNSIVLQILKLLSIKSDQNLEFLPLNKYSFV